MNQSFRVSVERPAQDSDYKHNRSNTITVGSDYSRANPFLGGDADPEEEKKYFLKKKSPRQSPRHHQTAAPENKRKILQPSKGSQVIESRETILQDLDGRKRDIEYDSEVNKYVINKMKRFQNSKYVKPSINSGHVSPTKLEK